MTPLTVEDVRKIFRAAKASGLDPDRLAVGEAFALAVVQGMSPENAAAFCGLRINRTGAVMSPGGQVGE